MSVAPLGFRTSTMRTFFAFFYHTLAGWKLQDDRTEFTKRFIVVIAPHTSNIDFWVGLCVRSLAGLEGAKFLAKKSLFKPPFGWFFKALGGYPVDRSKHSNMTEAVIALFDRGEIQRIGITPEGTRTYQPDWKTGFHRIATGAGVPIILCSFDYAQKTTFITGPFPLTDNAEADIERMKDWFRPHKGKHPENGVR